MLQSFQRQTESPAEFAVQEADITADMDWPRVGVNLVIAEN
jgi:hypothetical protein